jgi:hypothetical protein
MMQKTTRAPSFEAKYLTISWQFTQLMIKVSISLIIWNASLHYGKDTCGLHCTFRKASVSET